MPRHRLDHIGIWFEQRRKLGINDNILLGHYPEQAQQPSQYIYQHGNMDGISCLIHRFDELGIDYNKVPLSRDTSEPCKKRLALIKKKSVTYSKSIKWLYWNKSRTQAQDHLYTALFTEQQTHEIQKKAKFSKVSMNTLLFWSLNKACSELLIEPGQNYSWLYPVNMRGAIDYGTPYSNYSSGFYVQLNAHTRLFDLHQMIRQRLKSGQHWVSWKESKIAKYLPRFALRILYRYLSSQQFYAGSFSSLGEWIATQDKAKNGSEDGEIGWWYICAPGTANYPVSNCAVIYNGKLSCTLKLHKYITSSPSQCKEVLTRWSQYLLSDTEPPNTSAVVKVIHSTMEP